MANITTVGMDVIMHRAFTETKVNKTFAYTYISFCLFLPSVSFQVGLRETHMVPLHISGIIVIPVDLCCVCQR